ncbi:MAG: hypothetical protein SFY32_03120 [Bacteroidota bacterium]|nr:hypothetical protein [Bacteroidota bacterium]
MTKEEIKAFELTQIQKEKIALAFERNFDTMDLESYQDYVTDMLLPLIEIGEKDGLKLYDLVGTLKRLYDFIGEVKPYFKK